MSTLRELMNKFSSPNTTDAGATPAHAPAAAAGDNTKLASGGGSAMNSLQDIYLALDSRDHEKRAAARAPAAEPDPSDEDFAAMAEKIAEAEAGEEVQTEMDSDGIMKIAAEYDAAGRIMARGFFHEFNKLAEGAISASPNQMTESESTAKTPALGDRGLPTVPTNFAGSDNHDQPLQTTGANAGKGNYSDSLAPNKKISAGQGTGDDPEGQAISLGGGAPVGFATVRDLQA